MKLWIDDVRPAPKGYLWYKGAESTKLAITQAEWYNEYICECKIELIDIDQDAIYSGDYIEFLDWLEETGRNYPIRIHSMNSVDVANMRAIIEHNGWEVK